MAQDGLGTRPASRLNKRVSREAAAKEEGYIKGVVTLGTHASQAILHVPSPALAATNAA